MCVNCLFFWLNVSFLCQMSVLCAKCLFVSWMSVLYANCLFCVLNVCLLCWMSVLRAVCLFGASNIYSNLFIHVCDKTRFYQSCIIENYFQWAEDEYIFNMRMFCGMKPIAADFSSKDIKECYLFHCPKKIDVFNKSEIKI